VGNGIKRACESRRGRIRQLVTHLLAPNCAPVLEAESRRYAKTPSFEARKTILIHPAERHIQEEQSGNGPKRLSEGELEKCASSLWEFDRIYFYLVQEQTGSASLEELIDSVQQEFERMRAVDGGSSLVPLHYAIRALKTRVRTGEPPAGTVEASELVRLLTNIDRVINDFGIDPGRQVRDNLEEVLVLLNRPVVAAIATLPGAV
jgi:hypothetical protein